MKKAVIIIIKDFLFGLVALFFLTITVCGIYAKSWDAVLLGSLITVICFFVIKNSLFDENYIKKMESAKHELNVITNTIKELNGKLWRKKEELKTINTQTENAKIQRQKEYNNLNAIIEEQKELIESLNIYNINYVDNLEGLEFEKYVADILKKIGYNNIDITSASNDYGVDILAEKDGIKYAIQCKNYTNTLGNSCIQEVYSGKQYYNCHIGIVITNSTFTKNAIQLAKKDGIILWDRNKLIDILKECNEESTKN